jgi:catalase (peroxidase I)
MMMLFYQVYRFLALLPLVIGGKYLFLALQDAAAAKHHSRRLNAKERIAGDGAFIPTGGYEGVKEEIKTFLVTPQPFFPPDFGNYGGLMIHLA